MEEKRFCFIYNFRALINMIRSTPCIPSYSFCFGTLLTIVLLNTSIVLLDITLYLSIHRSTSYTCKIRVSKTVNFHMIPTILRGLITCTVVKCAKYNKLSITDADSACYG